MADTNYDPVPRDDQPPHADPGTFGDATTYVRPENVRPAEPNPFDNGTAEPAPQLGQPNGVPLEEVLAVTPPDVYARPTGPTDAVTAKASDAERLEHDLKAVEADRAAADRLEEAAALTRPQPAAEAAPPASAVPASPSAVPDTARESEPTAEPAGDGAPAEGSA